MSRVVNSTELSVTGKPITITHLPFTHSPFLLSPHRRAGSSHWTVVSAVNWSARPVFFVNLYSCGLFCVVLSVFVIHVVLFSFLMYIDSGAPLCFRTQILHGTSAWSQFIVVRHRSTDHNIDGSTASMFSLSLENTYCVCLVIIVHHATANISFNVSWLTFFWFVFVFLLLIQVYPIL